MPVHSGTKVGSHRWGASDDPYSPLPPLRPLEELVLPVPALEPEPVPDPAEPDEPPPDDEEADGELPAAPVDGAPEALLPPAPHSFCAQAASVGLRLRHAARLFSD